jgi:transcriptional regulator with XRE-family HTH domain
MARIDKLEAAEPKRRENLKAALEAGAFRLGAGCRLLRQLHGLSQADLAAMLGVNLKVIKALESGNGNPGLISIEKIAEAFGLAVVFVKKDTVAEAVALAAGKLSEQQINAKNAPKIGRMGFKIPPP